MTTEKAKREVRALTLQVLDHVMQGIRDGTYEPMEICQGIDWESQRKDKKTQKYLPTGYKTLKLTLRDNDATVQRVNGRSRDVPGDH